MPRIKMPLWQCPGQQLTPLDQHRVACVKVIWSPRQRLEQLLSSQNPFLTSVSALSVPSLTLMHRLPQKITPASIPPLFVVLFEDFRHLLSVYFQIQFFSHCNSLEFAFVFCFSFSPELLAPSLLSKC